MEKTKTKEVIPYCQILLPASARVKAKKQPANILTANKITGELLLQYFKRIPFFS